MTVRAGCCCVVLLQAVPPKISMTSEGLSAYMASLQEKRRQLEERRKKAEARQQVREHLVHRCASRCNTDREVLLVQRSSNPACGVPASPTHWFACAVIIRVSACDMLC